MNPKTRPVLSRMYGVSLNAVLSSRLYFVVGADLDFIRIRGRSCVANMINAITRVAQPKPMRGWRCVKIIGNIMPPI